MNPDDDLYTLGRMLVKHMETNAYAAKKLPSIIAVKTKDTGVILNHKVLRYRYDLDFGYTVETLLIDLIRNLQHFNIGEVAYEYYWNGDASMAPRTITLNNLKRKAKQTLVTFIYDAPDT